VKILWPGIESLSTHLLKLMRKGVTKLQNINLLKWCTYYGIDVPCFLLRGLPGEQLEDYADIVATVRLISHLRPPIDSVRLRMERFSPYYYDKELFPTKWQRPAAEYGYIYPSHVNLDDIAFFLDYESAADVLPEATHEEMNGLVRDWRASWYGDGPRASLTYRRTDSDIVVSDTRFARVGPRSYTLLGPVADIYDAFSSAPRTPAQACAALSSDCPGLRPDAESVEAACDDLCDAGLMIADGGKYLSLAIPADPEL